jgi:preprotein translocase subunit SecG
LYPGDGRRRVVFRCLRGLRLRGFASSLERAVYWVAMLYYLLVAVYILICALLLVVVLLQQGKGGDIAAAFGGAGSQTAFGARSGATFLTRATAVLGALFILGSLGLGLLQKNGAAGSVMSGVAAPAATKSAAPALPTSSAPPIPTTPPSTSGTGACARDRWVAEQGAGGACGEEGRRTVAASDFRSGLSRKWRNWQTHQLEGLALARAWGFESPLPHQHLSST